MICKNHGEIDEKLVGIYTRHRRGRSEVTYYCKLCKSKTASSARNEARRLYREGITNIEPIENIRARIDRKENPEKHKEWNRKVRARLGSFRNVIEISRVRGISTDTYQEMLEAQNNRCAICDSYETKKNRNGDVARLCLDHNHKTNKVRKFLCHSCNLMTGHFKESSEIINSAISYLNKHGEACK